MFSVDEKIRIVLEGLKGETSIAELCRRKGIAADTVREANSFDVSNAFYSTCEG